MIPVNGISPLPPEIRIYIAKATFGRLAIWTRTSSGLTGWVLIQPGMVAKGVGFGVRLSGLKPSSTTD